MSEANVVVVGVNLVHVLGGSVKTSSVQVAEFFGKQHYHVLRDIRNLLNSDNKKVNDFNASNFGCTDFIDKNGETRPLYELTRDGFAILAMGFTGDKAQEFKIAYIEAFNSMKRALQARVVTDAIEGKVSDRMKLGVSVRRGLSQRQWDDLYEVMRGMAVDDREYNAIHSHFARHFGTDGSAEPISYSLALGYLDRVRAAFACGYVPEYRNGRLVIEEAML